jgi:hypothetical protein
MHLTNQKWVTSFKGHELVEIEQDVENTSWKFTSFQVTQSYIAIILPSKIFQFEIGKYQLNYHKRHVNKISSGYAIWLNS